MGYVGKVKDTAGNTHLVGSTLYGTCNTAAATKAKVVTCSDFSELVTGVTIHVKFVYANTADEPTLNVNNTGAKGIGVTDGDPDAEWAAGSIVSFTYDGEYWLINDATSGTDTKWTAGSSNNTGKLYLIGAASQTSWSTTHSSSKVYETDGALVADSFNGVELTINPRPGDGMLISAPDALLAVPDGADYTLGTACEKDVDTSIGSSPTNNKVPTSAAVANYVASAMADTANFQGTLVQTDSGSSGTKWTQAEIEAASYKKGWYWVCETAGTYCGSVLEAGDMLFCVATKSSSYSASDFTAIQNNIETLTTTEVSTLWTNAVAVA